MARDLSAGFLTELGKREVGLAFLVYLDFVSGALRVWTGIGNLSWSAQTWQGVGDLGTVSAVEETTDLAQVGIELTLSGIPSGLIATALLENYLGRRVTIWKAFRSVSGALVADPVQMWSGRMDRMTISEGAETSTITVSAETVVALLQRERGSRYTHAQQITRFPGDLGLEFINGIQDVPIPWGAVDSPFSAPGPGGPGGSSNRRSAHLH